MPKAKRTYTEEQKQAMRDRLAAARAKKAAMKAEATPEPVNEEPAMRVEASPTEPVTETVRNGGENTEELLRQAIEAIATLAKLQAAGINTQNPTGPQVQNGRMVGTLTKFSIDPSYYPSPVERLTAEPRLAPLAFPLNYELDYKFSTTSYQNQDKINCIEPKFSLELRRKLRDEVTGEETGGRYVICRLVMHEDPQAAMEVARQNGIEIDESDEKAFLDEMRYIQMRDWLFESFFQPIATNSNNRTEMVVGGKIVEFFEIGNEKPQALPFGEISKFRV